jgi:diguanylate cyclase (GGDEF)-like protein
MKKDPGASALVRDLRARLDGTAGSAGTELVAYKEFEELARAYLKLDARFAKVLAISDKYQSEIRSTEPRGPHPLGVADGKRDTASAEPRKAARDTLARRLRERLDRAAEGDELAADAALLLRRYEKTNARLEKIVSISDSYQAQLRELLEQVGRLAHTDVLTGLPNRRAMLDRLEIELARAERYGGAFSVVLFDVDDFKRVNDAYGHEAGDDVLVRVAQELRGALRRADACARWGGEEFLALYTETDLSGALECGLKAAAAVAAARVPVGGAEVSVTLSGGTAAYLRGTELNALLKEADDALYRAKAAGKNRVIA